MKNLRKNKELVKFVKQNALMMGVSIEEMWSTLETLQNNLSEKAVTAAEAGKSLRKLFIKLTKEGKIK